MKAKTVYIFGLTPAPTTNLGQSGGETRLLSFLKYVGTTKSKLILVGTPIWQKKLKSHKIKFRYIKIASQLKFSSKFELAIKSIYLIIKTLISFDIKESAIIYCGSDLFWEVIPALYYKIKHPEHITWVQIVHHLYPNWRHRPGNLITNFFGYYLQKVSLYLIIHHANKIITENPQTQQYFVSHGFLLNNSLLTSNGIDFKKINQAKCLNTKYDAVFLGRLDPSKGVFDLLKIWAKVNQTYPQAQLALIGEGDPDIKSKLKQKNIRLLGFLPTPQVYSTLKSSRIFIFPSREEGWGIAIAEAMACQLPVVAWDLDNYRSIFGQQLITITSFNLEEFIQKTISLLDNPQSAAKIGNSNYLFSQQFKLNYVVKNEYKFMIHDKK